MVRQSIQAALLTHKWAIHRGGMRSQVVPMLKASADDDGTTDDITAARLLASGKFPSFITADGDLIIDQDAKADPAKVIGGVAIIPVKGVMLKNAPEWMEVYYGVCSTARITADVRRIRQMGVRSIVLEMDTPGGHVSGIESLNQEVRLAIAAGVEVHAFVNDQACSAGYFTICHATSITLCGRTADVGSIGTMLAFWDDKELMEEWGIKYVEVYAEQSTHKNEEWRAYMEREDTKPMVQALSDLNEVFLEAVREGRGTKLNKRDKTVLAGRVFMGEDAVAAGLADAIGTMEDVLKRASGSTDAPNEEEDDDDNPETPAEEANTDTTMSKFKAAAMAIIAALTEKVGLGQSITADHLKEGNDTLKAEGITGVEMVTSASQQELRDKATKAENERNAALASTAELRTKVSAKLKEYSIEHGEEATAADLVDMLATKLDAATKGKPAATHTGGKKLGDTPTAEKAATMPSLAWAAKEAKIHIPEPTEAE